MQRLLEDDVGVGSLYGEIRVFPSGEMYPEDRIGICLL